MTRRLSAMAALVIVAGAAAAAPTPPPALSTDDSPVRIDSTYGSGNFGTWHVDDAGLPAFRYVVDQIRDPRAQQAELAGGTDAQHQVGNDHIIAAAWNHGYTQLWSQDRLQQWANRWDPDTRHYGGGFGWLAVDGRALSTLFLDRPLDATVERDFGVGYVRKTMRVDGIEVEQITYAPYGDDPLLLDDVTITNTGGTVFLQMSETLLVTAQLAYIYPRLAELADRLGDRPFARTLRKRGKELRREMRNRWTGQGWYARGLEADGSVIGSGAIFGEPQPWAILAGVPNRRKAATLVANHRRFLGGFDAPAVVNGPTKIGSSICPASNDPDVTERSQPPGGVGNNNSNYVGGTWFDVNGWLTWSLAELDGIVPNAREYAWDEYLRNTLAVHATHFPDHWAGTISVDDVCYSFYSTRPEQCGNDLYREYDGQITEQPTWMVMDAIRLAGVTPTAAGYRIAPHLPFDTFSLRLPGLGVAAAPGVLRGYVRVEESDRVELRVRVPSARNVRTWANGRVVPHRLAGAHAVFRLDAATGVAADWAVTWGRRSGARADR